MTKKKIILRPGSSVYRRNQPLLRDPPTSPGGGSLGEVAGGTAAECAAVACCAPATVVNLVVLAVYKIPAGICRKALKEHKRRRLTRKGLLPLRSEALAVDDDEEEFTVVVVEGSEMDKELMELEKEMWQRFDSGGFWRSPSRIERSNSTNS